MREPTVETLLASERELIRVRDKARARVVELEAALAKIAGLRGRFHPIAGYQFEVLTYLRHLERRCFPFDRLVLRRLLAGCLNSFGSSRAT